MNINNSRIIKEIQTINNDINNNKETNIIKLETIHDNIYDWYMTIKGPDKSRYNNALFKIHVNIPYQFPFYSPKIRFITKIAHPNISQDGNICMDILKKQWNPTISILTLITALCSLLINPNFEDPLNGEITSLYHNNKELYYDKIEEYKNKYCEKID